MATTVSHHLPSAQAQAIADLTGYEDAATLRWQQACVQAAQQLTRVDETTGKATGRFAGIDRARLAKAVDLAQHGAVTLAEDPEDLTAEVTGTDTRKGPRSSTVDLAQQTCPCPDFHRRQQPCKHLLAAEIHTGALGLLGPEEARMALSHPPAVAPDAHALALQTFEAREAQRAAPAPVAAAGPAAAGSPAGAQFQIDNPAGCNLKFRIGPHELWFTFHDTSDDALLARLRTTLPLVHEIVEACAQRYAQRTPAVEPGAEPPTPPAPPARTLDEQMATTVQAALQAHGAASINGQRPPPPAPQEPPARDPAAARHDHDPRWCARHDVTMQWHDGNARGPGWFSHRLADGSYCKGK